MRILRLVIISCLFISLTGCATTQKARINRAVVENEKQEQKLPKKFILLPIDVTVSEISAGGIVEEVPDWSAAATTNIHNALNTFFQEEKGMTLLPTPSLSEEEQALIEEHVALYDVAAGTSLALKYQGGQAWEEKNKRFDYTLGDGLRFLKKKTDADAALIIIGLDQISSSGRKAAMVAAALFGVAVPGGISFITAGVVDLNTGDILWFNHNFAVASHDLRDKKDATAMLYKMLLEYPAAKDIKSSKQDASE